MAEQPLFDLCDLPAVLPEGITVGDKGLRYKGSPWPMAGDVCKRCHLVRCTDTCAGFGKQTPYTVCLDCKRSAIWQKRSTLEGYLTYLAQQMATRARRLGRECTIDVDFLMQLWQRQRGCCALSGIPMLHTYSRDVPEKAIRNASVDRINSDLGYTPSNTQLTCVRVNLMKGPLGQQTFFDLCRVVSHFEAFYEPSQMSD